jgi:hypothetical protein
MVGPGHYAILRPPGSQPGIRCPVEPILYSAKVGRQGSDQEQLKNTRYALTQNIAVNFVPVEAGDRFIKNYINVF